jgi:hypothetical protein
VREGLAGVTAGKGGSCSDSKGVDSVAGGSGLLILASCLQTGQKVRHFISHESMQGM